MTTYYVSGAAGSDGNDGLSEVNAKATIQAAINLASSGDLVYVKADAVYGESLAWSNKSLEIVGYDATPGDDAARVDLDGGGGLTVGVTATISSLDLAVTRLRNFHVHDFTSHGLHVNRTGSGANSAIGVVNCEIEGNGGKGIYVQGSTNGNGGIIVARSDIHDNTGDGVDLEWSTLIQIVLSKLTDNGGYGATVDDTAHGVAVGCVVARNASGGLINFDGVHLSTLDDPDAGDCWETSDIGRHVCAFGTGFTNAPAFGIDPSAGGAIFLLCCGFNANTSGNVDGTPVVEIGSVTSAPGYIDAANDDFSFTNQSGWFNQETELFLYDSGVEATVDIGAVQKRRGGIMEAVWP